MTRSLALTLLATVALAALPVAASWAVQKGAAPKLQGHHRDFDFWIGAWDVVDAADKRLGGNVITSVENGAALLERWTGAGGTTGTSFNYYDARRERWVQVWVTETQPALTMSGGLEDGRMVLVAPDLEGAAPESRITWTPLEDGRVRQHWEQTADGGASWKTVFDGLYVPREATDGD